ncbi:MAG: MFS transporter, partial [bacterium]|nr:MFS transporter [bacterium]
VKQDDLPNAIAMNSIQFNIARVLGPMLGGLALTKLGAAWCFTLNGASYLAVIASLVAIHARFRPVKTAESMLESMKSGINFIRKQTAMVSLILLAFLTTVLGIPMVVFLPVFTREVFSSGPEVFTLLMSISGGGSIVGALLVAVLGHTRQKGMITLVGLIVLGLAISGFAMSRDLVLS